jgi:hypothetical protein
MDVRRALVAVTATVAFALLLVPLAAGRTDPTREPVQTLRLTALAPSLPPRSELAAFTPCTFLFAWTATCKKANKRDVSGPAGACDPGQPRLDQLTGASLDVRTRRPLVSAQQQSRGLATQIPRQAPAEQAGARNDPWKL